MYGSMVAVKIVIFILLFREHALGLHLQPMTIVFSSSRHTVTLVFAPTYLHPQLGADELSG
jgi:hypothetical protein